MFHVVAKNLSLSLAASTSCRILVNLQPRRHSAASAPGLAMSDNDRIKELETAVHRAWRLLGKNGQEPNVVIGLLPVDYHARNRRPSSGGISCGRDVGVRPVAR